MSGRQRVGFSVPAAFSVLGLSCIVVLPADERQTLLLEISKKATAREWREISARIDKATAEIHSKGYYIGIGMLSPEVNMGRRSFLPRSQSDDDGVQLWWMLAHSDAAKTCQGGPKLLKLADRVRRELETMSAPYRID
ncbi:MAG TPA: hypothetical protein VIL63_01940 [Terriglobales bacterium]|jgi:hypothetical protein